MLTRQQQETVNRLGLSDNQIEKICGWDEHDMPYDESGQEFIGEWLDDFLEDYKDDPILEDAMDNIIGYDYDGYPIYDTDDKTGLVEAYTGSNNLPVFKRGSNTNWDKLWPNAAKAYVPAPPCHEGTLPVFEKNGITFHGGGTSRKMTYWPDAVIIDLNDSFGSVVKVVGRSIPELEVFGNLIIKIEWRDYGAPDLSKDLWLRLIKVLDALCQEKGGTLDVIVCCMGGHGRTGTALTILAGLLDLVPAGECPVKWVRDRYCKNAVESDKQEKYITTITGLEVTTKCVKSYKTYTHGGGSL